MSSWRGGSSAGGPKQSWKKRNAGLPAGKPRTRYWSGGGQRGPLISAKLVRFFLALTILLASTGFMVLQLWRQDLPTPIVSLSATEYASPWVPNGWAVEDQQRLRQLLEDTSEFSVTVKNENTHGTWKEILELELDEVQPGGPGGSLLPRLLGYRALVVHLSAHGVLNGDGEPCLLFSEADPLDETTWVPLETVLGTIQGHKRWQSEPPKTLLILDTGKQTPDARCGLFTTGFPRAALRLVQSLSYKDFAVLLACDDRQTAWTAPELGGSVFGTMVACGLRGLADHLAGNQDKRLTVSELHRFVTAGVQGYVSEHRGQVQTPVLAWCGEQLDSEAVRDFELASVVDTTGLPVTSFQRNNNVQRMVDAWDSFGRWTAETPSAISWSRSEAVTSLSRAEQLLWAGSAYEDAFEGELLRAQKAQRSVPEDPWANGVCGGALALFGIDLTGPGDSAFKLPPGVGTGGPQSSSGIQDDSASSPDQSESADAPGEQEPTEAAVEAPADSRAAQLIAWLTAGSPGDDPPEQPPERPTRGDRHQDVALLTRWFSQPANNLTLEHLDRALSWLGETRDVASICREEAYLRTIRDHLRLTRNWELEAQQQLGLVWAQFLRASVTCEEAVAIEDPRVTHQLDGLSNELLLSQRLTRDRIHGCETLRDVNACVRQIEKLERLAEQLQGQRSRLERAWKLRDNLAFELPLLSAWIASPLSELQPVGRDALWTLSGEALLQFRRLTNTLHNRQLPSAAELALAERSLGQLTGAASQAVYELVEASAAGQPQAVGHLMLALGLRPHLSGKFKPRERGRLHQDLQGRFRDLSERNTVALAKLEGYCETLATASADAAEIWSEQHLPQDPALQLAPLFFEQQLLPSSEQLSLVGPLNRSQWCLAGQHLRRALNGQPAQFLAAAEAARSHSIETDQAPPLPDVTQILRVADQAQMIASLVPADRLFHQPTPVELAWSVCQQKYALWQATRCMDDFWKTPRLATGKYRDFMSVSANDWIAVASRITHAPPESVRPVRRRLDEAAELAGLWEKTLESVEFKSGALSQVRCNLSLSGFSTGWGWLRLALYRNDVRAFPIALQGVSRLQQEFGVGQNSPSETQLDATVEDLPEGSHELIAWFRGHQSRSRLNVEAEKPPLTLAWDVEPPQQTTIRVNTQPQPARIAFVLDCSNSMGNNINVAKEKLLEAILALPPERTEICLFAFGHSTRYNTNLADSYAPDWQKYRAQANPRRPYNDVELLVPLTPLANPSGKLDANLERRLREDLKHLSHWGYTPLYESLLQANDLLKRDDGFRGIRKIIAITDGKDSVKPNLQGNQTARGKLVVDPRFLHSSKEVQQRLASNVIVDFIAFNFAGVPGELQALAASTNGKTYIANNKNLGEQLRLSLFPDRFTTYELPGERVVGRSVPLFDKQDIDSDMLPGDFEVAIDGTSFDRRLRLLGGEAIELRYKRGSSLTFEAYDDGDAHRDKQSEIVNAEGHRYAAIMLAAIPPTRPQLRMCLQAVDDQLQSRRPNAFLLELRRGQRGVEPGPVLAWTSDAQWESRHRAPVLRIPLSNLPPLGPGFLEARLWLPSGQSAPTEFQDLTVARLQEEAVDLGAGIKARADFQVQGGRLSVTITESREQLAPASLLTHWQVQPAPDARIEHRFYQAKVEHEFVFSEPTLLNRIRLSACLVDTEKATQWNASQWIRVP